jgi:hypothetical protein
MNWNPNQPPYYPQPQPAPTAPPPPPELPDSDEIRNMGERTPFFPLDVGTYTANVIGIYRVHGFKAGWNYRLRLRVVTSDNPEVCVGATYEMMRKVGDNDMLRRMTAGWLCGICGAIMGSTANWKTDLENMLAMGSELEKYNIVIGVQGSYSQAQKKDGTHFINFNFYHLAR